MNRPHLRLASNLSPADVIAQREAEARDLALGECRAVCADAEALLARCDQLVRLNAVPPGYAAIVRELAHVVRRRTPTMRGILTTQDVR